MQLGLEIRTFRQADRILVTFGPETSNKYLHYFHLAIAERLPHVLSEKPFLIRQIIHLL